MQTGAATRKTVQSLPRALHTDAPRGPAVPDLDRHQRHRTAARKHASTPGHWSTIHSSRSLGRPQTRARRRREHRLRRAAPRSATRPAGMEQRRTLRGAAREQCDEARHGGYARCECASGTAGKGKPTGTASPGWRPGTGAQATGSAALWARDFLLGSWRSFGAKQRWLHDSVNALNTP